MACPRTSNSVSNRQFKPLLTTFDTLFESKASSPHKPGHSLGPRADVKLLVYLSHVGVDRSDADAEFVGDFFGPMALGHIRRKFGRRELLKPTINQPVETEVVALILRDPQLRVAGAVDALRRRGRTGNGLRDLIPMAILPLPDAFE